MQPPPQPKTKLGRPRQLSPLAGVHVSPLCLGGMSIGDKWDKFGFGEMNKESSLKLLDAFYEAGGNFIDTANNYQNGTSEQFIGEWMEERGIRDQMVVATKVQGVDTSESSWADARNAHSIRRRSCSPTRTSSKRPRTWGTVSSLCTCPSKHL